MIPPLVSVVMSCFNSVPFLGEALVSILQTDYPNFEIILVDDGSTDASREVAGQFASDRIKFVQLQQNIGLAAALNVGLSHARGEYIARMDTDDVMRSNRIGEQVKFLMANPGIDLVGCGADVFGHLTTVYRSPETHQEIVDSFLTGNPFIHPTIMFRRKLLSDNLYRYDETLRNEEDYELWARLLQHGCRASNQPFSGINYRIHGGNNQFHPSKRSAKQKALSLFAGFHGISGEVDIKALVDFQCSGFISRENFWMMREYAQYAEQHQKPRLGWLQQALLSKSSYYEFSLWYWKAIGSSSVV